MESATRLQFLKEYGTIRQAEGRGSNDAEYYRALPYQDLSRRNSWQWMIRARTYRYFERRILTAMERTVQRPLDILDLGAGNGWMSYRLALRQHRPIAIDIFRDPNDGLAAARHYPVSFPQIEADFNQLPLSDRSYDLVVYNASFHYSADYRRTLSEARRCLKPLGRVVILDSPIYRRREHGEQMRAERHAQFEHQYGFRSDAVPSIEFLDEEMLPRLAQDLDMTWQRYRPWYGLPWALRPAKAKLLGRRPPSRFHIFVGTFHHR